MQHDHVLKKLNFLPTDPIPTVMLIYRHWVIMAYSEKSDIIVLEKSEVNSLKRANVAFALA